jgi:hypothetical protein
MLNTRKKTFLLRTVVGITIFILVGLVVSGLRSFREQIWVIAIAVIGISIVIIASIILWGYLKNKPPR